MSAGTRAIKMRRRSLLVTVFYCHLCLAAAQHRRKALYPSAFRVKRGTHSLVNPTFQNTVEGVNLLFEILLAGLQIEGEDMPFLIPDPELASLRRVQKLEVICEDILPKKLSEIRRLTSHLSQRRGSLSREDFERTVLTMVYTAQSLSHTISDTQRELWGDTLVQLFRAIKEDLAPPLRAAQNN
ncbi:protein FAM180A precursor [Esox lucius]|uniref:UNQ1940/PRO4423 n=1 Tax=Esox lucius TaxID=8010 RepID=C1BWJ1_ESOLU|nr:protein FAM180A precursor [Esox lucius]ACO13394.1 UNQ1940/PRO4423 precursor [Esox lucius]